MQTFELSALKSLAKIRPIAGLMRHAERFEIPIGEFGNEVSLTSQGEIDCEVFAKDFLHQLVAVYSSPVKRCMQTAELLLASHDKSLLVQPNNFLGDPGIFIDDQVLVSNHFIKYQPFEIVQQLLSERKNPPGFCKSTNEAVNMLIDFLLKNSNSEGFTFFVTHDSIMSVMLGIIFKEITLTELWPKYLETLFFWQDDCYLHISYRNHCKKLIWKI